MQNSGNATPNDDTRCNAQNGTPFTIPISNLATLVLLIMMRPLPKTASHLDDTKTTQPVKTQSSSLGGVRTSEPGK